MLEARAPAKLTLSLRVLGRRDDGFHDVDGLVVTVTEPHDVLCIRTGGRGVRLRVRGCACADVPADDDNLVARAAHLLEPIVPGAADVEVVLDKGIPAGAGLGGGSSDAAAFLRAMTAGAGIDLDAVLDVAARLGSDVPVCLHGGSARMRGRGDVVERVAIPAQRVLIVVPPFTLATPAVYRAWDELGGPSSTRTVPAPAAVRHVCTELVNDLEPAAEHVEPRLARFRDALEDAARLPALLAGRGSAYALVAGPGGGWRDVARRVEHALGVTVHTGLTMTRSA
jgi:4-diphosphocytidyl-2-C-methyl-D-erythritol kinase